MNKFLQKSVLIILSFLPTGVFALKPVVLSDTLEELCIAREYVEYFEDPSRKLTINEITAWSNTGKGFIESTAQDLINENTGSAYWLKFKLENRSQSLKSFRIELFDFDMDEISFFYEDSSGKYIEHKAGFRFPFSYREINHKNVSFRIPANTTSSVIYMRFFSKKHSVLEPMVRSFERTFNYAVSEYVLFGIVYGLLLLMMFYNFLYFINLRKGYYFYYLLYGLGALIYLMSRNGTGFQYIWYDFPTINDYTGETGLFIGTLAMLLFTNSFLNLKSKARSVYRILVLAFVIRIFIYGIQIIYPHYSLFEIFDLVYIQAVFVLAIILTRSSFSSAKWLVIAYSLLIVAFLVTLMEQTSIIPSGIFTVYAVNLGIILQFVFLSMGIAESVKETYRQRSEAQADLIIQYQQNEVLKEKVNRELEEKVRERTLEIDKKNEELKLRAEENMKMNVALDLANYELKRHLNSFAKSSVMKTHLDLEEFKRAYPDELSCKLYLRELKEKKGFVCIKCGNCKSIKGKAKFDVRCSKCNYNESLTANTIFHRIKFSLHKAFYMLYMVSQKKGDISSADLAKILDLQNTTCTNYKKKILERLQERRKINNSKEVLWDYIILDDERISELLHQDNI